MTVEDVRKTVKDIEAMKSDDEMAHAAEDSLYVNVLEAIRDGAKNHRELAREALRANDIRFARWCA